MDTITISRIARDGPVFLIEPPFVLSVRPTTANGEPYWEATLHGEPPLALDDGRSRLPAGTRYGWIASNDFTFNAIASTPEDLESNAIGQLWFWWDNFVLEDQATLSPWQKAIADRLRERMIIQ